MSKTFITVECVNEVRHHPDADHLDIVQILGFKVICGRDEFKIGDAAIYFPPNILLPLAAANNPGPPPWNYFPNVPRSATVAS